MKLIERFPNINTAVLLQNLGLTTPVKEVASSIVACDSLVMPVFLEQPTYFPDTYQIYSDGLECVASLTHSVQVEWYLPIPKTWTTVKPTCKEDRIVLLPYPVPRLRGNDDYYIGFLFHYDLKEIMRLNV